MSRKRFKFELIFQPREFETIQNQTLITDMSRDHESLNESYSSDVDESM
jgi:hypothetical protein